MSIDAGIAKCPKCGKKFIVTGVGRYETVEMLCPKCRKEKEKRKEIPKDEFRKSRVISDSKGLKVATVSQKDLDSSCWAV